jgi:hypothetical protein
MATVKRRTRHTVSRPADLRAPTTKLTMTINEVAAALGVTRQTVRNRFMAKQVPPPLPGTRSVWGRATIERYLRGEWQNGGWIQK